jgi:LacI family transcriptional regulator
MVGIRDVAERAGVSTATVSFYLNKPDKVRDTTAERIRRAIDELGYVRNDAARQLKLGKSRMLALVGFDVSDPFFAAVARGVRAAAAEHGLYVVLADSDSRADLEAEYVGVFEEQRVRGLLLAPVDDPSGYLSARGGVRVPTVLLDYRAATADLPSVSIDGFAGGQIAARHLVACGRRRLAFVGGPLSIHQVAERLAGFRDALASVPGVQLEVIETAERTARSGREVGRELASRPEEQRPDGIFGVNDLVTVGLVQTLALEHEVAIPETISLVGYNDALADEYSPLELTTLHPPQAELGRTAVELLMAESAGDHGHDRQVVFTPQLIVRGTSAPHSSA